MTDQTPSPSRRSQTLYKDPIDKKIGGVASGVAKYFDIDTTLVRAIWAVSILVGGFGLLLYLVLWFILEDNPEAFAGPIEPRPVEAVAEETPVPAGDPALEAGQEEIETETAETAFEDSPTES